MAYNPTISHRIAPSASTSGGGMGFMICAMLLLPLGDSFAKLLTGVMGPVEVTMWRLLAQAVFLGAATLLMRRRLHGTVFAPIIALSGLLLFASLTSLVSAFAVMPIATVIAIFFVEPLLLTLLAGPLLGEVPGPRRLAAVGVGLVGALIVIRPGFSEFGWVTLLPLFSALCYALNMIVLRRASATRSGLVVQCGTTLCATSITIAVVFGLGLAGQPVTAPVTLPAWAWGAILGAGGLAAASHVLIASAFRRAEASLLAPFQYLEILSATAAGYLVFGDFPDALTWLGVSIILGSGIYVFHRERQTATSAPRRRRGGR